MRESFEDSKILLATLPPSRRQLRLALAVMAALLAAFAVTAPFGSVRLPRIDAFVPAQVSVVFVNDLVTSVLMFAQFSIVSRRALLALAIGYLFSALMVIPYALTFPGLISPTGLFGAGLQTTVWLYVIWHAALPLSVLAYAAIRRPDRKASVSRRSARADIGTSVAIVMAAVCMFTWIATAQHALLPVLFLDREHMGSAAYFAAGSMLSVGTLALVVLCIRMSSVLDLWIMVSLCAWLLEVALSALLMSERFDLGWYMGRIYALIAASVVLMMLLSEITALYAHLARAVMRQRGERGGRQLAMDAMAASIAHEVNQPLAAIALNGQAALRFLARTPPNIDEVRAALGHIVGDSLRGSDVIASVRAMFKKDSHARIWCGVNDIVREALGMVDVDLRTRHISVATELHEGLPRVLGDRVQLQEVFLNLLVNAMEAMHAVPGPAHVLRVRSDVTEDGAGILVTIEDSGPGIENDAKDRIFEPFFTTKAAGTGMGLAICRSIIEVQGGRLWASPANPHGSVFHVVLPAGDAGGHP
jgi:signal transduction histidine kinase